MKSIAIILSCFIGLPGFCQNSDFVAIDNYARSVALSAPAKLSHELTYNLKTDLEKTRAIFRWITDNIDYRTQPTNRKRKLNRGTYQEPPDSVELKPLDERVAETVLENGVAICDGYARLFKTLCAYAGVRAEVVMGYARTEAAQRIQRFRPNHAWNAVMIDSVWQLLDVTWASGYITRSGGDFVRLYDEQYFLSSPDVFIREHYPDDLNWTLMTDPPLMPEFRQSPFKQRSFVKYKINSYAPGTGIIEAAVGDTLQFELTTTDAPYDRQISSDPFLDTSLYQTDKSALLVAKEGVMPRTSYSYIVDRPTVEWIYILYNDDLVLRYRLNVVRNNK